MKNEPLISLEKVYKSFGDNQILKGVTLTVNKGEDLVILGRSGTGKSVTIKCIVRLVDVDKGKVSLKLVMSSEKEIKDILAKGL